MKKPLSIILTLSLALLPMPTYAQQNECGTGPSVPFASETITVSTTAIGFTLATYAPTGGPVTANQALVFVNTNNLRARFDGVAPTTSVGAIMAAGQFFLVCSLSLNRTQFIRDDASDVEVFVVYSGPSN